MDVESDVGDVVNVLAGDAPDDLADLAFGPEAGEAGEGCGVDFLVAGELGDVVEGGALGVSEEGTGGGSVRGRRISPGSSRP